MRSAATVLLLTTIVMLCVCEASADDSVVIKLTFNSPRIVLGCSYSATIEVKNQSDKSIAVPRPDHLPRILSWETQASGMLPPRRGVNGPTNVPSIDLAPGENLSITLDSDRQFTWLPRLCAPGTYSVRMRINHGMWASEPLASSPGAESVIVVEEPTGADQDAYQALLSHYQSFAHSPHDHSCPASDMRFERPWPAGMILRDHPSSVHAAYVVYRTTDGSRYPELVEGWIKYNDNSDLHMFEEIPDDTAEGDGTWTKIPPMQAVAWREEWIQRVLADHPDIWFRDDLVLELAFGRIKLKQNDAAQQILEDLSSKKTSAVAGLAQRYLAALKGVTE